MPREGTCSWPLGAGKRVFNLIHMLLSLPPGILDKIEPEPNSGCWLWIAYIDKHGYGKFNISEHGRNRNVLAHRYVFELVRGPIPPGLQTDHLCKTRSCVNPAHLELVTSAVNNRRGLNHNRLKTHCQRGHPYSGDNLYLRPDGLGRDCKACRADQKRRSKI